MTRLALRVLLGFGLAGLAAPAFGAANATLSASFFSVDAACDQPLYIIDGAADFGVDDDGAGNDWLAFVYHDASGNYHDVDFEAVQTPADPVDATLDFIASLPFSSFLGARPLFVRLHDIPDPAGVAANSKQGLEFATAAPVLYELQIDPKADAAVCANKRLADWALRIESLKNQSGQTVTTSTALDLAPGTTALTIAVPGDSMLVALFRAECSNDANGDGAWVNVDIRVDGVGVAPTAGTGDALCSSNDTPVHDGWVMARTSAARFVTGPSVRSVQVFGSAPFGGSARLQDSELVVMVPEPAGWQQRAAGLGALALLAAWRRRRRGRVRKRATLARLAVLALLGGAIPVAGARADTVLRNTSHAPNQIFDAADGTSTLNLGGGTSFAFQLDRATRLAILFTAECAVDSPGFITWLDLDILVDGVAVPESDDSDDAFCTSNGDGVILDGWVSAAIHVTTDLAAGAHSIEVRGTLNSATSLADRWQIADLSLSLIGQEH